jgi:Zn-dependent protease with chaperone function
MTIASLDFETANPSRVSICAAGLIKQHQSLIAALRKLNEKNLSNLTPHPFYSGFYYSHPTLLEREAALMRLAKTCQAL